MLCRRKNKKNNAGAGGFPGGGKQTKINGRAGAKAALPAKPSESPKGRFRSGGSKKQTMAENETREQNTAPEAGDAQDVSAQKARTQENRAPAGDRKKKERRRENRGDGKPNAPSENGRREGGQPEQNATGEKKKNARRGGDRRDGRKDAKMSAEKDTVGIPLPAEGGEVEIVGVNFREAGKIYFFSPKDLTLVPGNRVIVETSRGTELGTVKTGNKTVPVAEITPPLKEVVRRATASDLERDAKNHELELEAAIVCKKKIAQHGLDMSLVSAEYTFDNSKLIFYFTCESRVDFRELVKDLAATFRTRIELRQIGIRDEAKMMGGLGLCGRKFCCAGFLTDFVQVSIKMAKEQNFSLNSAKVSGACGRLMCCLRYEHEVYEEAIRETPANGSFVNTPDGEGTVIETKPLARQIRVRLTDNEKDAPKLYEVADCKVLRAPAKKNAQGQGKKGSKAKNTDGDDDDQALPED